MKLSLLILFVCIISSVRAQVFVKQDAQGLNDGSSWQNAFTNLDSAIIQTDTGQIWVAAGTYKPSLAASNISGVFIAFTINKKIALYGGFSGVETSLAQRNISSNPTILSGDIGVENINTDNTPIVVFITGGQEYIDSNTVIDGFTITQSYASPIARNSGALYISTGGNPVISNCTITDNYGSDGGGVHIGSGGNSENSTPLLVNNTIRNNTANHGGGIYASASNPRIIGNKISGNKCVNRDGIFGGFLSGGGIVLDSYVAAYIYGNTIDSNYAEKEGGGIINENSYDVTIENNVISHNATGGEGGGLRIHPSRNRLVNNLITDNYAGIGGGFYADNAYYLISINNTIANNSARETGAVYMSYGNITFINTIIYSNPSSYGKPVSLYNAINGYPSTFNYCDVENGVDGITYSGFYPKDSIWQTGNTFYYPQFSDTANGQYQLLAQSSLIDAGIPDTSGLLLPGADLAGNARVANARVDIGCYEFGSPVLPLKILSFTASLQQPGAAVHWVINTGADIKGFELEKSADGRTFSKLSDVSAVKNKDSYTYYDRILAVGYNYYRLKITNAQGSSVYSDVASVLNRNAKDLSVFPNPVADRLNYLFKTEAPIAKYDVRIYDLQGKLLYKSTYSPGNVNSAINVASLSKGTYLLQITGDATDVQTLFIKE